MGICVVSRNVQYRADVQCALDAICPGVTLDANGCVDVRGVACSDYCTHRRGCNLIRELLGSGYPIEIRHGQFAYRRQVVWWDCWTRVGTSCHPGCLSNITDDCQACKRNQGRTLPAVPILVHELIHAWHDVVTGTYQRGPAEEHCTVWATNLVRPELNDQHRCCYGRQHVRGGGRARCPAPHDRVTLPRCTCSADDSRIDESSPDALDATIHATAEVGEDQIEHAPWNAGAAIEHSGFDDLVPDTPGLREPFVEQLVALVRGRRWWQHPTLRDAFEESPTAIWLEIVTPTADYRTVLVTLDSEPPRLYTNVLLAWSAGERVLGPPGDLVLHDLSADGVAPLQHALADPRFAAAQAASPAASVEPDLSDGDTHFLRVRIDGELVRIALRGFAFPSRVDEPVARPDDEIDGLRWDAIRLARNLARAQLLSVEDLPGTVLQEGPMS